MMLTMMMMVTMMSMMMMTKTKRWEAERAEAALPDLTSNEVALSGLRLDDDDDDDCLDPIFAKMVMTMACSIIVNLIIAIIKSAGCSCKSVVSFASLVGGVVDQGVVSGVVDQVVVDQGTDCQEQCSEIHFRQCS